MEGDRVTLAYRQGEVAYRAGLLPRACPYDAFTKSSADWHHGYIDAQRAAIRAGTAGLMVVNS